MPALPRSGVARGETKMMQSMQERGNVPASQGVENFFSTPFVGPGEAVRHVPCTKGGDDMTVTEILQLLSLLATVVLVVVTAIKK